MSKHKRRICVFSGARADYGPMLPLIRALGSDRDVILIQLITGSHQVGGQGLTARHVVLEGCAAVERVDMVLAEDTPTAVAKSFGLGVIGYADALDRLRPDILVVLGDRYEALAVAICAALRLLPIAHINGGEVTTGSTDDLVRHAISKLAQLHFTAAAEYRQRVVQMGEDPARVFNTGAPSLDGVRELAFMDRTQLAAALNVELRRPTIVATYHPATTDPDGTLQGMAGLISALEGFDDATIVFTGTNVDQGSSALSTMILEFANANPDRVRLFPSLGQQLYLNLVGAAEVVVGNSSSGLLEAPVLHTPTVNVGSRQNGRLRAASVLDCGETAHEIAAAIRQALSPECQEAARTVQSPYGDGRAVARIIEVLKGFDLAQLLGKDFYTYPVGLVDAGLRTGTAADDHGC